VITPTWFDDRCTIEGARGVNRDASTDAAAAVAAYESVARRAAAVAAASA
jgi:hypothetical protein